MTAVAVVLRGRRIVETRHTVAGHAAQMVRIVVILPAKPLVGVELFRQVHLVARAAELGRLVQRLEKRFLVKCRFRFDELAVVDPDDPWSVSKDNILAKCGWSPFEDDQFKSRVTDTWVNGNHVYKEGAIVEAGNGKRLVFGNR